MAFQKDYKKDAVRCLPRTLAENEWGGKEKITIGISRGECWLKEIDGVDYVEWRHMSAGREGGCVRDFSGKGQRKATQLEYDALIAMMDQAKFDWKLCKSTAKALEDKGEVIGELHDRITKAVAGLDKGHRAAEKSFSTLRGLKDQGQLSPAGVDAMKTLGENIKACLHRGHNVIKHATTHTPM